MKPVLLSIWLGRKYEKWSKGFHRSFSGQSLTQRSASSFLLPLRAWDAALPTELNGTPARSFLRQFNFFF